MYVYENEEDLEKDDRPPLTKKSFEALKRIIAVRVLHAKRDVASSESKHEGKVLSTITTKFFNARNKDEIGGNKEINELLTSMDASLDEKYSDFFKDFLKNAKTFLGVDNLRVA